MQVVGECIHRNPCHRVVPILTFTARRLLRPPAMVPGVGCQSLEGPIRKNPKRPRRQGKGRHGRSVQVWATSCKGRDYSMPLPNHTLPGRMGEPTAETCHDFPLQGGLPPESPRTPAVAFLPLEGSTAIASVCDRSTWGTWRSRLCMLAILSAGRMGSAPKSCKLQNSHRIPA